MSNNEEPTPEYTTLPINYKADDYVGWFMSDAEKVRKWTTQLFACNVILEMPMTEEIRQAAENALLEVEDDVTKLRGFLEAYKPVNKKEK